MEEVDYDRFATISDYVQRLYTLIFIIFCLSYILSYILDR